MVNSTSYFNKILKNWSFLFLICPPCQTSGTGRIFMTAAREFWFSCIAVVQWLPGASRGRRVVITGIVLYCQFVNSFTRRQRATEHHNWRNFTSGLARWGVRTGKRGLLWTLTGQRKKGGDGLTSPKLLPHACNQEALCSKWSWGAVS